MTQEQIAGTRLITVYMGYSWNKYIECFTKDGFTYNVDEFAWHTSLDAIAPVVKKVKSDLACGPLPTPDGWTVVYKNINVACLEMDATMLFAATVAAIQFINDKKRE